MIYSRRNARCSSVNMSGVVRLVWFWCHGLGGRRRGLVYGGSLLHNGGGLLGAFEAAGGKPRHIGDGSQHANCLGCPERCHGELN